MPETKHEAKLGAAVSTQDIDLTNPYGVASVYSNDFGMGLTLTDVRLLFAEIGAEAGQPSKILRANVVVPLQLAEVIAQAILQQVGLHRKTLAEAIKNAESAPKK